MEEMNLTMADLMEEVEKSMKRIRRGEIKQATVISVEDKSIILNIGYLADAILPWAEYSYEEVSKEDVQVGDTFNVQIFKIDDGDGNVLVSKKRAESEQAFGKIEALYKEKAQIEVKIKEAVKGGVITSVHGMRAFIPGSQLTDTYVSDLSDYVGKTLTVEIIEFSPEARKLVLSGKAIARAKARAMKEEKFNTLVEGEKYEGTVTKLMPYGAFVNIGGVEGLVHNSDLSWTRIKHPSDVVKEGEKVQVTVLAMDKEKGKISLGMKDVSMDPWFLETANMVVGQVTTGKVIKFMNFGAFVRLADHVEGLVHISQITEKRIAKPEEVLELGQEVTVKVINMDKETKKIGLSIVQVQEQADEEMQSYVANEEDETATTLGDAVGDQLKGLL